MVTSQPSDDLSAFLKGLCGTKLSEIGFSPFDLTFVFLNNDDQREWKIVPLTEFSYGTGSGNDCSFDPNRDGAWEKQSHGFLSFLGSHCESFLMEETALTITLTGNQKIQFPIERGRENLELKRLSSAPDAIKIDYLFYL